ncbi:MAG: DNA ligase [Cocleimonas sp.]|nr:DNA ligase [Cocleimonas sp.]
MIEKTLLTVLLLFIGVLPSNLHAKDLPKPALMLANVYHEGINLNEYWVSEKYDGVRTIWDGKQLISRGGNIYHAPKWFTQVLPKQKLDGELWIARQSFEQVVSTVRDKVPDDAAWRQIKFMVFDMPELSVNFDERLVEMEKIIKRLNTPWVKVVKQWKVTSHPTLMKELEAITKAGAEGLMLHKGSSLYKGKRSGDLLKVKRYEDAEAVVIKHIGGKGKYTNMLGAMIVEIPDGTRFKIGSGFSDSERQTPPAVGKTITYQYRGKTKNGIPRFATYLRVRKVEN